MKVNSSRQRENSYIEIKMFVLDREQFKIKFFERERGREREREREREKITYQKVDQTSFITIKFVISHGTSES